MADTTPPGMTGEKLRFIKTYISECDSIVGQLLQRAIDQGADIPQGALDFVDGKAVQADLELWADWLDGHA